MENVLTLFNRNWLPLRQFDELLDDVFVAPARIGAGAPSSFAPHTEVDETESHFLISMDLPGVPKENIQIEVVDGNLRVAAQRKASKGGNTGERPYGKWERHFSLPKGIDFDHVEASCEDGVLRIAIPKAEAAKPRLIKIQEGKAGFFQKLLSTGKKEDTAKPDIAVDAERSA